MTEYIGNRNNTWLNVYNSSNQRWKHIYQANVALMVEHFEKTNHQRARYIVPEVKVSEKVCTSLLS